MEDKQVSDSLLPPREDCSVQSSGADLIPTDAIGGSEQPKPECLARPTPTSSTRLNRWASVMISRPSNVVAPNVVLPVSVAFSPCAMNDSAHGDTGTPPSPVRLSTVLASSFNPEPPAQ